MSTVQIHHHIVINQNALQEAVDKAIQAANRGDAELLADYLETSGDFPDSELADSIENASREFRQSFRLRSS